MLGSHKGNPLDFRMGGNLLHIEVDVFKPLVKYEGDNAWKSREKGRVNDLDLPKGIWPQTWRSWKN